ncbi:MAG: RusA family crossover junction endodeoxyribonuclease [Planctomycetota bacterium]|jgi:Holliday junction resolvase RusA-like endonuclease|nr:MAG: RusA family crossover junction endodeoxyribonuclease [Planctomycetota bacterium]
MTLQFDLPYPPSVNHYWRRVGARTLISRQGRIFRESVCSLLALRRLHPLDGPLSIEIDVFPPDHRRRDIDNLLKSLLDALEAAGVYHNDSQIVELTIRKLEPVADGRTRVRIEEALDSITRTNALPKTREASGQDNRRKLEND